MARYPLRQTWRGINEGARRVWRLPTVSKLFVNVYTSPPPPLCSQNPPKLRVKYEQVGFEVSEHVVSQVSAIEALLKTIHYANMLQ